MIEVSQSFGDVLDRITILNLKIERIGDRDKVRQARYERDLLRARWEETGLSAPEEEAALYSVNAALWTVEDELRRAEAREDFGERFVALARRVYQLNDQRAEFKRRINIALGSAIVEVKSYGG